MAILQAIKHNTVAFAELWSAWSGLLVDHHHRAQSPLGWLTSPYFSETTRVQKFLPPSGNALWYREPAANLSTWSTEWLPIGNGPLGAMVTGGTTDDMIQLNLESFWSGGPFANKSYTGGNPDVSDPRLLGYEMGDIRDKIWRSKTGETDNVRPLTRDPTNYGSFSDAGYLVVTRNSVSKRRNYLRWLDLDSGLLKTVWSEGWSSFAREYFCSYPTKSCTAYLKSINGFTGDTIAYSFVPLKELKNPSLSCHDEATLKYRGQSHDYGMQFEFLANVQTVPPNRAKCHTTDIGGRQVSFITVKDVRESWITWVGDTEYDINAGNENSGYSFAGPDPHNSLLLKLDTSTSYTYSQLKDAYLGDYHDGMNARFSIDLGATPDFSRSTAEQVRDYTRKKGNPHLEWVLFNYGRYMLFSSARGVLPANLQGVWAKTIKPAWSADYHANINTQMNYWGAEV